MLKNILFITCLLSISCNENKPTSDFSSVANQFINEYAILFPDETPLSIDNSKLAELHIPTNENLKKVSVFYDKYINQATLFEQAHLSSKESKDLLKMKNILKTVDAYLTKSKTGSQFYDVKLGFERILKTNYAPTDFRLQTLFNKLENVPKYYEAAKNQLQKVDTSEVEQIIKKQTDTYYFFDKTLPDFVAENHQLTPQYVERLSEAKLAVKDYIAFIESFKLQQ
jgi:hypothetical protein